MGQDKRHLDIYRTGDGIVMDWEERKQFYDEHYHTTHSGYVTAEGVPSVSTERAINVANILYDCFKPRAVLDCGCATGWTLHGFLQLDKAVKVAGCDISEFVVNHTYPDLRDKLKVVDISEGLPYDDGEFDLVLAFDLLEHLQDYDAIVFAAKEICRVSSRWIVIRTPMVRWVEIKTQQGILDFLISLNPLPHKVRLTLPGIARQILDSIPATINLEHPNEHPRQFWVALFTSLGCQERQVPEKMYHVPNAVNLHSFDSIVFEKDYELR